MKNTELYEVCTWSMKGWMKDVSWAVCWMGKTFKEKRRMYTAMRHALSGGTGSNLKQTVVQYTRE